MSTKDKIIDIGLPEVNTIWQLGARFVDTHQQVIDAIGSADGRWPLRRLAGCALTTVAQADVPARIQSPLKVQHPVFAIADHDKAGVFGVKPKAPCIWLPPMHPGLIY